MNYVQSECGTMGEDLQKSGVYALKINDVGILLQGWDPDGVVKQGREVDGFVGAFALTSLYETGLGVAYKEEGCDEGDGYDSGDAGAKEVPKQRKARDSGPWLLLPLVVSEKAG